MTHANFHESIAQEVSTQNLRANRVIVMTRYPEPGKTKTRLIPSLGPDNAAYLHSQLIKHTWNSISENSESRDYDIEVRFFGGDEEKMRTLMGADAIFKPQQGETLGEKMHNAVESAFQDAISKTILIGTDCTEINSALLYEAFETLNTCDVVIGPATDGGYYLLALNQPTESLFSGIEWGTETVLDQTLKACREKNLHVKQLQPLSDVDYPEDLINCRKHNLRYYEAEQRDRAGVISIIIPTLNEEQVLGTTLESLSCFENVEIIIADGGSSDRTREIVKEFNCRLVESQAGRGRQMNAGAAVATGETLLFMHADSSLPNRFREEIQEILHNHLAGAFRLKINDPIFGKSIVEWGANLRSRFRQMPYGDQGFFIKAKDFFQQDGFRNWPIMEDYEFCNRLRKVGRIGIADSAMKTSGRRWKKRGLIRNTLKNQICLLAYKLGFTPEQIARFYS